MTDETIPKRRAPRRPKHLGTDAAALWREVTGAYGLRPDELRILEAACREVDICEELEEARRGAPLTVKGSQGQPVASPYLQELRQHRQALRALLGQLHLPDEDESRQPTRPGTFGTQSARDAAAARWSGGAVAPRGPKAQRG